MPSVAPHASALLCCVGSSTSHAKQKAGAFVMSGALSFATSFDLFIRSVSLGLRGRSPRESELREIKF